MASNKDGTFVVTQIESGTSKLIAEARLWTLRTWMKSNILHNSFFRNEPSINEP